MADGINDKCRAKSLFCHGLGILGNIAKDDWFYITALHCILISNEKLSTTLHRIIDMGLNDL